LSRRLRQGLRRLQPLLPESSSGLLVLAYHLVGAESSSPVDLPKATFARQMAELCDHARVLSLDEALRLLEAGEPLPERSVVLTFDDAYANFLEQAWPILERHALPVTLFVPVRFVDGGGEAPIRGTASLAALSWHQLEELVREPLLSVGSHSRTHADLRRLAGAALRDEIAGSRQDLEARLGVAVRSFGYPRSYASPAAERLVADCYDAGFVAGGRRVRPEHWRPARTPRLPLRRDMPASLLPMLRSPIWIEEAVADRLRRWRRSPA
jgi:peptidoglycan/xylan/chitin deacetylase (PgdA/CDA1 family)